MIRLITLATLLNTALVAASFYPPEIVTQSGLVGFWPYAISLLTHQDASCSALSMCSSSYLPQWVSYSQALGVPLAALIVTLLGVWIAARQMLIANEKVSLDRFNSQYERRFVVYEATRSILEKCFRGQITEPDARMYGLRVIEARFLFDEEMYAYLREVQQRVSALWYVESQIERESGVDVETRAEFARIKSNTMEWIIKQGEDDRIGIRRFEPFLKYVAPDHPWILRWP